MEYKEQKNNKSQQAQAKKFAPIDYELVLKEFEADREFLNEVIEGFITQGKSQIESIRNGLESNNTEIVAREAHSLKGAAANLHAKGIFEAASILDKIAKTDDVVAKKTALESIIREFETVENYFKNLRDS